MPADGPLRVVALNLRSGGAPRAGALTAALAAHEPDVVVLGEAYPTGYAQVVLDALREVGLEHRLTAEGDTPRYPSAVALASRLRLEDVRQPLATGPHRQRLLEARVGDVLVAGAYFPLNKPKVDFWRAPCRAGPPPRFRAGCPGTLRPTATGAAAHDPRLRALRLGPLPAPARLR